MADTTLDNLTAATGTDLDDADLFLVLDGTNPPKKITRAELVKGLHGTGVAGDVLYHNGTTWVRLAKGTAGQVLAVNSGATAPEWVSGGLQFISSTDASSVASVDFTGWGSLPYDFFVLVLGNVIPATDNVDLLLRTTANDATFDSGAADYAWAHHRNSSSAASGVNGSGGDTDISMLGAGPAGSAAGEDGVSGVIQVFFPHLTKKTQVYYDISVFASAGSLNANRGSGARLSSAAATGVRLFFSSGNIESGTVTLYGGRNA